MGEKRHIVIAKLFDSGGMNTHFATLSHYLGAESMIVILESEEQRDFLQQISPAEFRAVYVIPALHHFAHLEYRLTTNVKEAFLVLRSMARILGLSLANGIADITISAAEPEKYLYFLWLPFLRVIYILHSEPKILMSRFTRFTCNRRLGRRKRLITVSDSMKRAICTAWQLAAGKKNFISVIHNCILEDKEEGGDKSARAPGQLRVTTLGHVDQRKNPATWLEVAKLVTRDHPETEFVWLGNGALLEEYRILTDGIDRIIFQGKVKDVQTWLHKTTVYYQPSLVEPHGIATVEAMSAGLPCVVARTGGLSESVEDGVNGNVVEPTDVPAHVSAIENLLKDAALREYYGENSLKRFRDLFTYPSFKEKMDEVYLTV
jgi:glycosyltransferase involved in cell wall biosynthesis